MSRSYKKTPIIKYGGYSKYGKKLANHKWRKTQEANYNIKSLYKRNYLSYNINDVVDMWTKEDACAHYDKIVRLANGQNCSIYEQRWAYRILKQYPTKEIYIRKVWEKDFRRK